MDKETSGLLIIAKNLEYTKIFGRLFKEKLIKKLYLAICYGSPKYNNSEIKLSIKDKKDQNKLKESITKYKVLAKMIPRRKTKIILSIKFFRRNWIKYLWQIT